MNYLYSDARLPLSDRKGLKCGGCDQQELRYSECYAKVLLEILFPNVFDDLQIADTPDLRSAKNSIGIEVTSSIDSDSHRAGSLYSKWSTLSVSESNPETETQMHQLEEEIKLTGAVLSGGILCGPNGIDSFGPILKAVKSKLKKLRSGNYAELSEYQLFIQSDIFANDVMIKGASKAIRELCAKDTLPTFSVVYVSVPEYVYAFDTLKNEVCSYPVDSNLQCEFAERARAMMIEEKVKRMNIRTSGDDGSYCM